MTFSTALSQSMHKIQQRNVPWGSISDKYIKASLSNGKAAVQSQRKAARRKNLKYDTAKSTAINYTIKLWRNPGTFHGSSDTGRNWN